MKVRLREACLPSIPGGPDTVRESRAVGNCFGLVVSVEEDGSEVPLSCSHGGSCWLCRDCAKRILAENERVDAPEGTPFWITRVSDWGDKKVPCEGAYAAESLEGQEGWRIRLKSLDELLAFIKEEGEVIVSEDDIRIYDDHLY